MAVRTFRIKETFEANGWQETAEADQTVASSATGWTVGKTAATNYSQMQSNVKRAATSFTGTARPDGLSGPDATLDDCFLLTNAGAPFNGTFAATAWSIVAVIREVTTHAGLGRIRVRVWAATGTAGATLPGIRELTSAVQVGAIVTPAPTTTTDGSSTVTWTPGSTITLTAEYLFVQVAWEITTAAGATGADEVLRLGTSANGSRIVTSDFTPPAAVPLPILVTGPRRPA